MLKGEIIMTVKDVITARYIIEECLDVRFMLDTMRFGPKIDVQDMMILWEPILNISQCEIVNFAIMISRMLGSFSSVSSS